MKSTVERSARVSFVRNSRAPDSPRAAEVRSGQVEAAQIGVPEIGAGALRERLDHAAAEQWRQRVVDLEPDATGRRGSPARAMPAAGRAGKLILLLTLT